ncbi:MAG: hypothetical protein K8U57_21260 [Planctomycetes bacterium]|nr:hypothetical protein [Planctomycetota bacterium]
MRNGTNKSGTPTFRCRSCGRRFVTDPKKGPVGPEDQALVLRLLAERLGVRAISHEPPVGPAPGSKGSSTPCIGRTLHTTLDRPQKVSPGRD